MTARLVVGSLPDDERLDAISTMSPEDEEEDRITRPWLPESATSGPLPPTVSLRAPRVPRELAGLSREREPSRFQPRDGETRDERWRESGLRRVARQRFFREDD
jgi:hypothetical protein